MLIISIIVLIISIVLINKNEKNFILFLFFIFLFFTITNVYIISDYFTGKGIDESFIYHLSYGIEGAGLKSDIYIILIGIGLLILSILIPILIYKYFPKKDNNTTFKTFIAFIFLIIAFVIHPFTKNILELNGYFLDNKIIETNLKSELNSNSNIIKTISGKNFSDIYKLPEQQKATLENKNIVFIYLESYENLYLDEELFPGLSNGLNKIKKESIYFDNINQAYGTSWTIAGMVGSQCGIPLINSGGGGNSMHGIDSFLSGAFCVGDFLKSAGYNLNYMGGSDLGFAGKGNFYRTHGFNSIEGKDELKTTLVDKSYIYNWGLYDDTVFDLVYKKYETLSKKEEKFGLFMLNLDTHGSKGAKSKECDNLKYNNDKDSILNTYHCTDYLLNNFINKVKQNENFKDTIIVIASDHYAMALNNSMDDIKKKEDERNMLFLIIDPSNESKIVKKEGTTLDIGPTVLSSMGFNVNNLGLGVNLLNKNTKTIQEEYDDFIFQKWKKNYESFWDYPSIKNGFTVDLKNNKVTISDKKIGLPTLMHINDEIEIEKILWMDTSGHPSLFEKIPENSNSIFIDSCDIVDISKKGTCILYTNANGNKKIDIIKNNENISIDNIKNSFLNR